MKEESPLEKLQQGEANSLYVELADWLRQQLAALTSAPSGPRYDLEITLKPRCRH
jgi:hypothetical protein